MIHAKYSPSMISRVIHCPGSVQLCDTLPPQPEGPYAAEGTLLHEYAKEAVDIFFHEFTGGNSGPPWMEYVNRVGMTKEHEELILEVVNQLEERILNEREGVFCEIIQDIRVHTTNEVNGTLDLAVVTEDAVHIIDFKFGAGVAVEAEDNEQLMCYLIGFLHDTYSSLTTEELYAKNWYNWIFQPRLERYLCAHVHSWHLDQFIDRMNRAIRLSKVSCPPFHAGEHCRTKFCPAGGCCKERIKFANEEAAAVLALVCDKQITGTSWAVTNEELAKFYKMEKEVSAAFAAVKEHLHNELHAGRKVPGYKLVAGRGKREWYAGVDMDMIANASGLDAEDLLDTKLKSPAQVEKLLNKNRKAEIKSLINSIEGAPTMAPDTSSKVEVETAAQVFGGLEV